MHNILRLPNVRQAKFVLRHVDQVHAEASFQQIAVASVQNCLDECVTHSSCKSINYFHNETAPSDLATKHHPCELVAQDLTDRSDYVGKPGWKHYDTGRTRLTRILHYQTGYCYFPVNFGSCDVPTVDSSIVLRSGVDCDSILAYFEYDRDTGIFKNYQKNYMKIGTFRFVLSYFF